MLDCFHGLPDLTAFGEQCKPGDVAPYVLVPGSKGRVRRFAAFWEHAHLVAEYHEFLLMSGSYHGIPVTACSTGIGGTSVSIAVQELIGLGAHTLIRVGVTGPLQPEIQVGDVTIASGAIRRDRVSDYYLAPGIPALAHYEVVLALVAACQQRGTPFHVGVGATAATFYPGEGNPGFAGYSQASIEHLQSDFRRAKVHDWDTETATLLSLAVVHGIRAGRINGVLDSFSRQQYEPAAEERAVQAGLDAVRILAQWDARPAGENLATRF